MNYGQKIFRSFEFLDYVLPKKIRLPFRYGAQSSLRALEPEMKALDILVPDNMNSIDIGANRGFYSYALSKCRAFCFKMWGKDIEG